MVTKDYSKSRMRENRTYGSVRGGQSNLIPSTRLTQPAAVRVVVGGCAASLYKTVQPPWRARENMQTAFQAEKPYNRPSGDGNAPLLPPAAASPPEGEICSMLPLALT